MQQAAPCGCRCGVEASSCSSASPSPADHLPTHLPQCRPSAFPVPFLSLPADANYDALVTCLPSCCGPDNPPKYAPILAGEHLMARLRATHMQHSLAAAGAADA